MAEGDRAAPAKGKLREGDRITAFDGTPVRSWDQVTSLIRDNGARTVRLEIDRSGDTLTVPVTLAKTQRRSLTDPNAQVDAGFLGVEPTRTLVSGGPSPRHVDPAKALPLTYAMALLLVMMSGLMLYADIVNPVTL